MNRIILRSPVLVVVGLLTAAGFMACSSSPTNPPTPVDPAGSCDALASRCHHYDKLSAIGHECHELGHAGDDNACAPKKDECFAACPPYDAATATPPTDASTDGTAADARVDDGGQDGGNDVCPAYCQCLNDTCAAQTGYPFTSVGDCVAKCVPRPAEEKDCFPKWCEKAKTLASKTHACEHAWGALGLDECETL
jgi:hypothetical protein